ncbi:MAG: hypothetical protein K8S98_08655 [Planctomycetes bacterium]|nr:hypothetical protein [Planctomycetota bacterium]
MRFVTHPLFALGLCVFPPAIVSTAHAPLARSIEHSTATPRASRLDDAERAALISASARSTPLGAQRAGDVDFHLSDRDIRIVAIAVVVTILIIAIA